MEPTERLPSYAEVYRLAFSPERYGKRIAEIYANDVFYRSRLQELSVPQRGLTPAMVRQSCKERCSSVLPSSIRLRSKSRESEQGALEGLTRMPVDILYEVFSHLHPRDVLTLSRTTKRLRDILRAPHAHGVWKASMANVQALPACPSDLTEYQYAHLAFNHWCHFCLTPGVREVAWVCRVRCCRKCLQRHFISEDELDLWIPEDILIEKPDQIFPFAFSQKRQGGRYKPVYYLPRVLEILEELENLMRRTNSQLALDKWSQEKKELQAARVSHASLCEYWYTHWVYCGYQRDMSAFYGELCIVIWLVVLLCGLWREQLASTFHNIVTASRLW